MPALWPGFTAAMNPWFCGNAKGDTDEDWQAAGAPTAKKIAAPAPGVTQLDPGAGAIPGLASTINDAFHSNNCAAIAPILVSGFIQHLTMISGIYTGLVPTPAGPVPTPVPWMGVA